MSWIQSSVCDECGKSLIMDESKKEANAKLKDVGGYTIGGYHLCPTCNTLINRKALANRVKDKS